MALFLQCVSFNVVLTSMEWEYFWEGLTLMRDDENVNKFEKGIDRVNICLLLG